MGIFRSIWYQSVVCGRNTSYGRLCRPMSAWFSFVDRDLQLRKKTALWSN